MNTKRLLSFLLAISMIISMLPMGVFATEGEITGSDESEVVEDPSGAVEETESPVDLSSYAALELDVPVTAQITTGGEYVYFTFTPTVSCNYWFTSHTDMDTYGCLYDVDMVELICDDDDGEEWNFGFCYYLDADTTYILGVRYLNDSITGSFDVSVSHYGINYTSEVEVAATCTQDGVQINTCQDCGLSWTETVPAGHSYETTESVGADCTTDGYSVYTCTGCGDSYTESYPAWGHSYYVVKGTSATCTEDGYGFYQCTHCGDSYEGVIPATGHSYDRGICTACGHVLEVGGTCGEDINWTLSGEDGILRLTGTGAMTDYFSYSEQPWSDYRYWITAIEIGEGITTVGDHAFRYFYDLSNVSLPSTLTSIGAYAFSGNNDLRQILLPEGLTELKAAAFESSGLVEITLPGSLQTMGNHAFASCMNLGKVVLEEGITSIETGAFSGCNSLVDVSLPSTLSVIGRVAFRYCSNLREIQLPAGLTTISNHAFSYTALESVVIPAGVTNLDPYAFDYCDSLMEIVVEEGNADYSSVDGVVYSDSGYGLLLIPCGKPVVTVEPLVSDVYSPIRYNLQVLIFTGNAPDNWANNDIYTGDSLIVYYPADNETWTEDAILSYPLSANFLPLPELTILLHPESVDVGSIDDIIMSVMAHGTGLTYQWQIDRYCEDVWEDLDGQNSDTLILGADGVPDGAVLRCVVTDENGNSVISDSACVAVTLTVDLTGALDTRYSFSLDMAQVLMIRFTPDETGMYVLYYEHDAQSYYLYFDGEGDRRDGSLCGTNLMLEAGREYTFYVDNQSGYADVPVDVYITRPVTMTEGQVYQENLNINEHVLYQFVPTESGWYDIINVPRLSLEDSQRNDPEQDSNYVFHWLEAGETYYLTAEGRATEDETYDIMVRRPPQLSLDEEASGAVCFEGANHNFYFTPAESGMYRVELTASNGYVDMYHEEGWQVSFSVEGYCQLEAGVCYRIRVGSYDSGRMEFTVAVREPEALELGVDTPLNNYSSEVSFTFTPDETGVYTFLNNYGVSFSCDGASHAFVVNMSYANGNLCAVYMEAGKKYMVTYSPSWMEGSMTRVDRVETVLTPDVPRDFACEAGGYYAAVLNIETAGYYDLTVTGTSTYMSLFFVDTEPDIYYFDTWAHGSSADGVPYTQRIAYLEPGQYFVWSNFENGEADVSILLQDAAAPNSIYFDDTVLFVDDETYVSWNVDPYYSGRDFVWTFSEPGIVEITDMESGGRGFYVRGLAAGTVTVTATAASGATCSATFTVKEPTQLPQGQEQTISTSYGEMEKLAFTPAAPGYYCIRVSGTTSVNMNWFGSYYSIGSRWIDGSYYAYVRLYETSEYQIEMWNYSGDENGNATVTVKVDACAAPTSLSIPETLTVYLNSEGYLDVDFGDPWAYADLSVSIDGSAVYNSGKNMNRFYLWGSELGTATVTMSTGDGSLSASCVVTVVDGIELTLNESVSVEMTSGGSARFNFTPTESGYYVFHYGDECGFDIRQDGYGMMYYSGINCATAYLDAGTKYTVYLNNWSATSSTMDVTVTEPAALELDQVLNADIWSGRYLTYQFTPETTGYYYLYVDGSDLNCYLENWDLSNLDAMYVSSEGYRYIVAKLEAGKKYAIRFYNDGWYGDRNINISIHSCPAPNEVSLSADATVAVGGNLNVWYYFNPVNAMEDFTITSSDESVLALDQIYFSSGCCNFIALSEGTVTVTIETASGLTSSVTVTVVDPVTLTPGESVNVTLDNGETSYFQFSSEESGYYVLCYDNRCSFGAVGNYSHLATRYDYDNGLTYWYIYLYEGGHIEPQLTNYSESAVTFDIMLKEAEAPVSATIPASVTGYVGSSQRIDLTLGSYWEYGQFSWSMDSDCANIDWADNECCYIYCTQPGTATLTATSSDGSVVLTCEVIITEGTPLTLGETVNENILDGGSARFTFTPAESGYYFFHHGESYYADIMDSNHWSAGYYRGTEYTYAYLNAGEKYTITVYNDSGMDQTVAMTVTEPAALELDQPVGTEIAEGKYAAYQFTADATGYYYLRITDYALDGYVYDWNQSQMQTMYRYIDGYDYLIVKLEAGQKYLMSVYNDGWAGMMTTDFLVARCDTPTGVSLGGSTNMVIGQYAEIYFNFDPYIAAEDFTVTTSDENVLALSEIYYTNNYCRVYAAGVGTATITITTASGLTNSITVTVREPVELVVEQLYTVNVPANSGAYFAFTVEESGYYIIYHNNNSECEFWLNGMYDEYSSRYSSDGTAYTMYYLYAGEPYSIGLRNHGMSGAESCDFELKVGKAQQPISASLPENVTGFAGSAIRVKVESGSDWEMFHYMWNLEGDCAYIDWSGNETCQIYCSQPGTATLTATSIDGSVVLTTQIIVSDSLAIQVGQTNTVTMPYGAMVPMTFTPEQTGYYRIRFVNEFGDEINRDLYFKDGDSMDIVHSMWNGVYRLEAGREYCLRAYQYSFETLDTEVYVELIPALALDETVDSPDCETYYTVTVDNSGWYWFTTDSMVYMSMMYATDYGTADSNRDWCDTEDGRLFVVYLDAGVEYCGLFYHGEGGMVGQITFTKSEMPTDFYVWCDDQKLAVGDTTHIGIDFDGYARCNVTVTFSEEGIVELFHQYGNDYDFRGLKEGTVTVTFTTENGLSESVTLEVVEPEEITEGEAYQGTFETDQEVFLEFTAGSEGYYVVYCSDANLDYDFYCPYGWGECGQRYDENGGVYRYYRLYEGGTCSLTLTNRYTDEAVAGTVLIKKAEPATSVTLPESIQVTLGSSARLEAVYGSYWEYTESYWGYYGDGISMYGHYSYCYVYANGMEGGTITLRWYDEEGMEHSTSCQVVATEPETLTIGQVKEYQASGGSETTFYVKPEEDGWYFIDTNTGFDLYRMSDMGTEYVYGNEMAGQRCYYLEGGYTYRLQSWSYGDDVSRILVYQPQELIQDTPVTFTQSANTNMVYFFAPSETRMYAFRITDGNIDINLRHQDGWGVSNNVATIDGEHVLHAYLEEGCYYALVVSTSDEAHSGTLTVENSNAPQNFWVDCGGLCILDQELDAGFWFEPYEKWETVSVHIVDPTILEITEHTSDYVRFRGLKVGSTEVVFVCESGFVRVVTIDVVEPTVVELTLDEPYTTVMNDGDVLCLRFDVTKYGAGNYMLGCDNDMWSVYSGYWQKRLWDDEGNAYLVFYHYGDGYAEYIIRWYEEPAEVTFWMTQPAMPDEILLSDTELTLGTNVRYWLESGFAPTLSWDGGLTWTTSDPDVVQIDEWSNDWVAFHTVSEGTAVITATTAGGLSASCVITVKNPTVQGEILLNEYITYQMAGVGDDALYSFTAPYAGDFFFACMSDVDAMLKLMDADMNMIAQSDDYYERHAGLWCWLEEGETVYFLGGPLDIGTVAELTMIVSDHEDVYGFGEEPEYELGEFVVSGNSKYQIVYGNLTWEQARELAESLGGHLVCITSAQEQAIIEALNAEEIQLWIGAYLSENGWAWVTGETWDYENWLEGEPSGEGEGYAAVWPTTWNDMANDNLDEQCGFIVEFDVTPYLSYHHLMYSDGVFYEDGENDFTDNFTMTLFDGYMEVFYVNYMDENGQWVSETVHVYANEYLDIATMASLGEAVYGVNAEYFYRFSGKQWDTVGLICYDFNGQTLTLEVSIERPVGGFYSDTVISNETYLDIYRWDPSTADGRVFYFAFDERMSHVTITDCYAADGKEYVTLEVLDGNMVKITVNGDVAEAFWLELRLVLAYEDGYEEEWGYGISCGNDESVHQHSYTGVVTAPTCTEDGYTTYTCSGCGHSYADDYEDALGHAWVPHTAKPETCTEDGMEVFLCTACGETKSEVLPATGHSYSAVVTAPTCTEDGYTTYTCACGDSYVSDYVAATGHSYDAGKVTTAPTCTSKGVKTYTCGTCGETKTEEIAATGHSYTAVVTKPTCTAEGYTTHTCSACGNSYVSDKVAATGHTYDAGKVTTAPTCTTKGVKTYTCHCGHIKTVEMPALGHTAGDVVYENYTTTANVTYCDKVVYCQVCGSEISRVNVPYAVLTVGTAAAVKPGETVTLEVSVSATKYASYQLTIVYDTEALTLVEIEEGDEAVGMFTANTDTGTIVDFTARNKKVDGVIFTLTFEVSENATGGLHEVTCDIKGFYLANAENLVVDVISGGIVVHSHSYTGVVTKPNCTEDGYTTYTCSGCGDSYVDDYEDALGHAWVPHTANPATCTEDGMEVFLCTACGETKSEVLPATGHSYSAVVTAPTCTEDGYTTYTCSGCGHSYVDDEVAATGHTYDAGKVTTAPTCTTKGVKTYTCHCGHIKTVEMPALGHTAGDVVCENYTTTANVTYCDKVVYCQVCGSEISRVNVPYAILTVDKVMVAPGETVTLEVSVSATKYASYELTIIYDTEVLTLVEIEEGDAAIGMFTANVNNGMVVDFTSKDKNVDGVIFTMTFEVPKNAEEGFYEISCDVSGFYLSNAENLVVDVISGGIVVHSHSYTGVVTKPTCTEAGYTTYTCACGDSYVSDYVAATGHSYDAGKVTTAPTCTEKGVKTYTCGTCGETKTEEIAATGHSYTAVVTKPTCTAEGYTTHTCSACGNSYVSDKVAATGHTYDAGKVTTAPTCTTKGVKTYTCHCGHTKTEEIAATGHSYSAVVTAPTCTEDGYTTYTCSCGHSYVTDTVKAQGHVPGDAVKENVAGSYYEEVVYCESCGAELSRIAVSSSALGDLNGDGEVDIKDANLVCSYYNELIDLSDAALAVADVNGDGEIDIKDANLICSYYNEVIDSFPAEQ